MRSTLAEKGTKKLMIIKNDKIVYEWFADGSEDSVKTYYTASLAKALVGGMSLLAAMDDKYITLDEAAFYYIPSWKEDGVKSKITIRHLRAIARIGLLMLHKGYWNGEQIIDSSAVEKVTTYKGTALPTATSDSKDNLRIYQPGQKLPVRNYLQQGFETLLVVPNDPNVPPP